MLDSRHDWTQVTSAVSGQDYRLFPSPVLAFKLRLNLTAVSCELFLAFLFFQAVDLTFHEISSQAPMGGSVEKVSRE